MDPTPVALSINTFDTAWTPGSYQEPLTITNSDGTAPVATSQSPSLATASVIVNPGTNSLWPVATYPFVLDIVAVAPGADTVTVSADGEPGPQWLVTVTALPPETVSGNPSLGVVTPPAPPSA